MISSAPIIDVSHPCWTGVEDDFDHEWKIEDVGQGDELWYQPGWVRTCQCCGDVDEKWDGHDGSDDY